MLASIGCGGGARLSMSAHSLRTGGASTTLVSLACNSNSSSATTAPPSAAVTSSAAWRAAAAAVTAAGPSCAPPLSPRRPLPSSAPQRGVLCSASGASSPSLPAMPKGSSEAAQQPPPLVGGGLAPLAKALQQWMRGSGTATSTAPGGGSGGGSGEVTSQSRRRGDSDAMAQLQAVHGPLRTGPMVPPRPPVVIIISGPSGVGKDSVLTRLKEKREDLYFVVTATSRGMRPGEVEGKDYFFVSKERFEEWIDAGDLLEHAVVYGEYKGIPKQQVDAALAAGSDVVLRIDVQGAATVRKLIPSAISIFVAADSEAALVSRLVARKTETLDRMAVRVATARSEMDAMHAFDYVVVNSDGGLEQCASAIGAIIDAEKSKVSRVFAPGNVAAGAATATAGVAVGAAAAVVQQA